MMPTIKMTRTAARRYKSSKKPISKVTVISFNESNVPRHTDATRNAAHAATKSARADNTKMRKTLAGLYSF